MSSSPTFCMLFEAIDDSSAIAKVAMAEVKMALRAGFKVSVVATRLHESLRPEVEWARLYCPPRVFALQWLSARYFFRNAIGNRTFDIVHAHQPQVGDLADLFQCHFLTRVAYEKRCLEMRSTLSAKIVRAQQQLVLYAEDRIFRNLNPRTHVVFCSDLLKQEFLRLYKAPGSYEVLSNACPAIVPITKSEREAARAGLVGNDRRTVIGYLGGLQERKGYKLLMKGIEECPDLVSLMGGQFTKGYGATSGKVIALGPVDNVRQFYAACDIMVVPSYFDPCPLVVLEAVAHGVPVVATEGVGNLPQLLQYGAGAGWDGTSSLGPTVRAILAEKERYQLACAAMAAAVSEGVYECQLLRAYEDVLRRKCSFGSSVRASCAIAG